MSCWNRNGRWRRRQGRRCGLARNRCRRFGSGNRGSRNRRCRRGGQRGRRSCGCGRCGRSCWAYTGNDLEREDSRDTLAILSVVVGLNAINADTHRAATNFNAAATVDGDPDCVGVAIFCCSSLKRIDRDHNRHTAIGVNRQVLEANTVDKYRRSSARVIGVIRNIETTHVGRVSFLTVGQRANLIVIGRRCREGIGPRIATGPRGAWAQPIRQDAQNGGEGEPREYATVARAIFGHSR